MNRNLIKAFWNCGDSQIIDFAIMRSRLNFREKDVVCLILDQCMTQEQVAEKLNISTRNVQETWYSATTKLLNIPWVYAYAKELEHS